MEYAELDWIDGQPHSTKFNDIYFTSDDGFIETKHVFLKSNQLAERFQSIDKTNCFTIGETGFGSGLNFLATWDCFIQHVPDHSKKLHFISTEKYPLKFEDIKKILTFWPELSTYSEALLQAYKTLQPGQNTFYFNNNQIKLTLIINDALDTLITLKQTQINAWFLDGFSPAKNPDLWQMELFQQIARLSVPQATFATFTCAGFVRRGLKSVGFTVKKIAGCQSKREISVGTLTHKIPPY